MTPAACLGCGGTCGAGAWYLAGAILCAACVERLRAALPPAPAALTARPADAPCFLCGGPLEPEPGGELAGFAICAPCTAALVAEADAPADDELAAARDRRDARFTPGAGTTWCAGCGRPMPGPGSFRWIDGAPHCPACAPLGAPATVCAACGGPGVGPLRSAHGFHLCAACLDSHPTLALAIARARHRRALAHIGRRLLDDGDD